ncbi:MAG: ABC transporter permease subunit [Granulosicoccus sp.]|nr:ABC transporter permease subunit [Granulosicoccus sp.]
MGSLLRNRKFREVLLQATMVSLVAIVLVAMTINMRTSLEAQGMTSGFAFLERSTGWDFSFAAIDYSISDTYRRTLLIGILNTLLLGVLGISFATIFGVIVGLVRTSKNYLFSLLGTIYVEVFRNVPLILQAVFWYAIVSHLPRPRSAYSLGDVMFLSGRGVYLPTLHIALWAILLMVVAVIMLLVFLRWLRRKLDGAGNYTGIKWSLIVLTVIAIAGLALAGRVPDTGLLNIPALKGLNIKGGLRMPPELTALVIAIALYGGAYIGEVVRAGLMSVPGGQIEAGRVLGLKNSQIFTRIRLPLAVRLVLPSLTNQYVQLMKATTIGIVVGFSDFFMIISTSINQSGQTLELLAILMLGFLMINLSIAFVMNTINRRIALKGYEVKS